MLFTSFTYVAFLVLVIPLLRTTRGAWRERVILGASFVYYAAWDVRFVPLLVALGVFTFGAARRISAARGAEPRPRFTGAGWPIAAILVLLAAFKYTRMVVELGNWLLPLKLPLPSVVLPLGISFFTFECISYLLDVERGTKEILPLRRFMLFPAYWPHMVAGPILRIKELAPELENLRTASWRETLSGVDRVVIGLVKKVVIADSLATFVDQGFAAPAGTTSCLDGWALATGFALQIFFDFSGYSDIAIGVSRMVGIRLPENFNLPYHAASPSEFWNRWHMTLSRWIRDYLFFPLNLRAGKRIWLRYVYLVAVMTLVGLWHGAGPGFILWGTWHGLLMVGHRVVQPLAGRFADRPRAAVEGLGRLASLALIVAAWIPFRAPSLAVAGGMLRAMFTLRGLRPAYSVNDYLLVGACVAGYWLVGPAVERHAQSEASALSPSGWRFWVRAPVYALAVAFVFMFDRSNVAFIYFQF